MDEQVKQVEAFYELHPYPRVAQLARQRRRGFTRGVLNYLLRRRREDALPARAAIWVAGCGTQQGIHWALSCPDAEVLATDLSESQLATSASLARQIGIQNLRFAKQDLLESDLREGFDLVVCTGVVHHTPDPPRALANLRAALRPGGALQLMVYSSAHREPLRAFRGVVDSMVPPAGDAEERFRLACDLLEAMLASERCSPPYRSVFEMLWESRERDRSFFADAILHPLDTAYDVDGFIDLLGGAGLRHTSWLHPSDWDIATYIANPALRERMEGLSPIEQWKAVYTLAGHASPMLEALCEPREAPEREPYSLDELLATPLASDAGVIAYKVEDGRVVATGEAPPHEEKDGMLIGRGRAGHGPRRTWSVAAGFRPVLDAFDGRRTFAEVVAEHADELGEDAIVELVAHFLPHDLGVIVPCFD